MKPSIFRNKHHDSEVEVKDCQVVGAYVPQRLADSLLLASIHYGMPKSSIIRHLLEQLQERGKDEKEMLNSIADSAIKLWTNEYSNIPLWEYIETAMTSLRKRGLKKEWIQFIGRRMVREGRKMKRDETQ